MEKKFNQNISNYLRSWELRNVCFDAPNIMVWPIDVQIAREKNCISSPNKPRSIPKHKTKEPIHLRFGWITEVILRIFSSAFFLVSSCRAFFTRNPRESPSNSKTIIKLHAECSSEPRKKTQTKIYICRKYSWEKDKQLCSWFVCVLLYFSVLNEKKSSQELQKTTNWTVDMDLQKNTIWPGVFSGKSLFDRFENFVCAHINQRRKKRSHPEKKETRDTFVYIYRLHCVFV